MIIGVLVELSSKNIDKIFDYKVPVQLEDKIKIGIRVEVPFGSQRLEGFVLEIKDKSSLELKEIIGIVDEDIVLNEELLYLGREMQKQTLSTLISCYQVMLPKALKAKRGTNINKKYDIYYSAKKCDIKLTPKQKEMYDLVSENKFIARSELVKISSSVLNNLLKNGALVEEVREHYRLKYDNNILEKKELTDDQKKVVNTVLSNPSHDVYLLYGVTGSGKTEVYMELIEDALNKGKTSIVLVPVTPYKR